MENHAYQKVLLDALALELKEQEIRFSIDNNHSLKQLKKEGLVIHPISVVRKSFGYAEYPEISFKIPYFSDTSSFKDNCAIECFIEGEAAIKGILLFVNEQKGEFRLFAPDFPDWIEDKGVGLKLSPDQHTIDSMAKAIKNLPLYPKLFSLFSAVHGNEKFESKNEFSSNLTFYNEFLNDSQKSAVQTIINKSGLTVVHGPPGTGKTTTIVEAIVQLSKLGKKVLVSAPSNTAVDVIAKKLLDVQINIVRVGNVNKVEEAILAVTPEGKMANSSEQKQIKKLKIKAEEYRKMASQYKRNFGKEESQQRNLLFQEVKKIRSEIKKIKSYFNENLFEQANVVLGTPIGINDSLPYSFQFDTLFLDEAGQTLEPLAWLLFPFAENMVLSGDPYQLPPTVLSNDAAKLGLNKSILEQVMQNCENVCFLNTQYRMRKSIAAYSNTYFYENLLQTPEHLRDLEQHLFFYDTAGTGFEEEIGEDGGSKMNTGEIEICTKIIQELALNTDLITFISPYSAQIELAKKSLPKGVKIKTIDSIQGQENHTIILSLVRSNTENNIGFLKDYRRMNVALTRAKEKLIIIGDSATISQDKFYENFLTYLESINAYHSAWEVMA